MNWGGHWRILAWAAEIAVDADASCFEALLNGIRRRWPEG